MDTLSDTPVTTSESQPTTKIKKQPVSWLPKEESFLVDCLFDACDKGKQIDSGFKPEIWTPISARFVNELGPPENGPPKNITSIKNKVNSLKQDWKVVRKMVLQSGWGWDEEMGLVKIVRDTYVFLNGYINSLK
jgi:hypothetical protein